MSITHESPCVLMYILCNVCVCTYVYVSLLVYVFMDYVRTKYMNAYTYVCPYVMHVCMCLRIYVCVNVYVYVYMHACVCICVYVRNVCLYVYIDLCNICMYVCIYIYVHIQGLPGGKDLTSGECSLGQTIPI